MPTVVALLAIIVLPMILYYTGIASSLTAGTSVAGALLIFSRVEYLVQQDFPNLPSSFVQRATPTVVAAFIAALIVAHAAVAWTYQRFNVLHFAASLVPLSIMILAGGCLQQMLRERSDAQIDTAMRCCFLFFCLSALGSLLGFAPPSPRLTQKPVFPFNEPSHFGIIFTPFLIYCCIRASGAVRYLIWFVGILIATSLQNLTLLAGCAVAALTFVRGVAVVPAVILAGSVGMVVDLTYYVSRVDLTSDNPNLSVLTYIQGWQLIGESLSRSGGWGVGFQQLGLFGTDVPAADLIFQQTQEPENLLDGSFNFAKAVSEFGVFGILLSLAFLRLWWRSISTLRRVAGGMAHTGREIFALCVIAGYAVEVFVRGAGYFTPSGMLLCGALWLMGTRERGSAGTKLRMSPAGGV